MALSGQALDALGCSVSIPAYPLATVADHNDCLSLVTAVYLDILSGTASSDIALLGDSAGGGMALALAQSLRDGGVEQPGDIVLLSPWLDLSLGNPEVIAAEKVDALLAIPGLLEAARMYAGGTDLRDPRLSPIYGSLEGLGRLAVFVGAEEMFVGDARKLRAQLDQRGIAVDYREYAAMFHDWCLFPLPEAHRAIGEIIGILRRR